LLLDLKKRVRAAQIKAATSVNRELSALYLHIGKRLAGQVKLHERQGKALTPSACPSAACLLHPIGRIALIQPLPLPVLGRIAPRPLFPS